MRLPPLFIRFSPAIQVAIATVLIAAGVAGAAPDKEKIFLSGPAGLVQPFALAQIPGARWLLAAFRGAPGALYVFDTFEWKDSTTSESIGNVNDPVAITISGNRAYVANHGNQTITVLELDTDNGKPKFHSTISGGPSGRFGSTSTPRPIAMLMEGNRLWVLNYEGTVSKIDISLSIPVRISFTQGSVTGNGDVRVCGNTATPANLQVPLSMTRQGSFTYIGCENGVVTRLSDNGTTMNRTGLVIGSLGRGRAVIPHPSEDDVLLYVDDENHRVLALDTTDSIWDSGSPVVINPLCAVNGINQNSIPLTGSTTSNVAAHAFIDPATSGDPYLAVLNARGGASGVQMIRLLAIDSSDATAPPDCSLRIDTPETPATGNNIEYAIAGAASVPTAIASAGIPLQMGFDAGYLFVPNYSAGSGVSLVSVFTSNPYFESGSAVPAALSGNTEDPEGLAVLTTRITLASDESTSNVRAKGRIDDTLLFETLAASSATNGLSPAFNVTTNELITKGIIPPGANEIVQVLAEARDSLGNYGRRLVRLPVDSLRPGPPAVRSVGGADRVLIVNITPGVDPRDNETGVSSGVGEYRVVFRKTLEERDDGTTIESFAAGYPEPEDPERRVTTRDGGSETVIAERPNQFIPESRFIEVAAGASSFQVDGLTNLVTYTFDVYSLDRARNISETASQGEGMPDAGIGLFDILGENGCSMGPSGSAASGSADYMRPLFLAMILLATGWRWRKRPGS